MEEAGEGRRVVDVMDDVGVYQDAGPRVLIYQSGYMAVTNGPELLSPEIFNGKQNL